MATRGEGDGGGGVKALVAGQLENYFFAASLLVLLIFPIFHGCKRKTNFRTNIYCYLKENIISYL